MANRFLKLFLFCLERALRYYVFVSVMIYAVSKLMGKQFRPLDQYKAAVLEKNLADFKGMQMVWIFFGASYPYVIFAGIFQVLGAVMLLFERTKLLGAMIQVIVLLNIVVMDYFYGVVAGALFNAAIYLGCLLIVLLLNWKKAGDFLGALFRTEPAGSENILLFKRAGVSILLALGLFLVHFAVVT